MTLIAKNDAGRAECVTPRFAAKRHEVLKV